MDPNRVKFFVREFIQFWAGQQSQLKPENKELKIRTHSQRYFDTKQSNSVRSPEKPYCICQHGDTFGIE